MEGENDRGGETYPGILAPELDEALFADRVGYNKPICSSTPGQGSIPIILINTMSPDRTLNVVVMCILFQ
jgi:hypothetical protein